MRRQGINIKGYSLSYIYSDWHSFL